MSSKEKDTSGLFISPVLPTELSSRSLSKYLQEEYPEFCKRAFGIPDSDTDSSEYTGQPFHPVSKSDSSVSCQIPLGQCNEQDSTCNSNKYSSRRSQKTTVKRNSVSEKKVKGVIADKKHLNKLSFKIVPIALAKIVECALSDLSDKLDVWLGKLKCDILKYAECLATHHHEHQLAQKVLRAWLTVVQTKRKKMCDKSYHDQIEDKCRQLSCDYEEKIKCLKEEIDCLNIKLEHMEQEQELYARNVKQAFMRGICALNNETMSAFTLQQIQVSPLSKKETKRTSDVYNQMKAEVCIEEEADDPLTCDQMVNSLPADLIISTVPDTYSISGLCTSQTFQRACLAQEDRCNNAQARSPMSAPSSVSLSNEKFCSCTSPSMDSPVAKGTNKQFTKKSISGSAKSQNSDDQDSFTSAASVPYKVFQTH